MRILTLRSIRLVPTKGISGPSGSIAEHDCVHPPGDQHCLLGNAASMVAVWDLHEIPGFKVQHLPIGIVLHGMLCANWHRQCCVLYVNSMSHFIYLYRYILFFCTLLKVHTYKQICRYA